MSRAENYDMPTRISDLKNSVEVQIENSKDGDPYMTGMANGLLLAYNIIAMPYGAEVDFLKPKAKEK